MNRAATIFTTLRGWCWLCAALALAPLLPFAAMVWNVERDLHARLATSGMACGTGFGVLVVAVFTLAAGGGLLVALLGAGSFLRVPAPRARARRWELLLAASAPLTLPALYFVAMRAAGGIEIG